MRVPDSSRYGVSAVSFASMWITIILLLKRDQTAKISLNITIYFLKTCLHFKILKSLPILMLKLSLDGKFYWSFLKQWNWCCGTTIINIFRITMTVFIRQHDRVKARVFYQQWRNGHCHACAFMWFSCCAGVVSHSKNKPCRQLAHDANWDGIAHHAAQTSA